jgi:hypothetical protein
VTPRSRRSGPALRLAPLLLSLCLLAACGKDAKKPTAVVPPPAGQLADFSLTDVNPNSATHEQPVSPRRFLGKVSAWYFGHAT